MADLIYTVILQNKIVDVIKPGGMLGIIVSNSWLGTNTGVKFVDTLKQKNIILSRFISVVRDDGLRMLMLLLRLLFLEKKQK